MRVIMLVLVLSATAWASPTRGPECECSCPDRSDVRVECPACPSDVLECPAPVVTVNVPPCPPPPDTPPISCTRCRPAHVGAGLICSHCRIFGE